MSMLTPPGMGGKYRITGNRFPHMRRPPNRRRIVLGVVATTAVFGLAGWGTAQLVEVFTGGTGEHRSAAAQKKAGNCKGAGDARDVRRSAPVPKPGDITVNVYNATPRGGLAKITADELERRGFRIGRVGNAEEDLDKKVEGTGVLLGPRAALDGAMKVLGTQLAGTEAKTDDREGQDIDLVLGTAYSTLTPKEQADKALAALTDPPRQQPSPSASATAC
ncbi:LytR C-terminal domain-containing protein [Streptomyces sp. SCA3-4]|uniref:LytR C-terminal domain-containing protein n=1 Tax=Streptomyces sichuanensis TaxID=2871810 RepID=UPI001CE2D80E|nr:LytR C-terminal domain-containing protein [Streptomyces sichuanensis]MCA6095164.1 LytR C-terminal domain-containing protein [Streptomyces sichuanensis]